MQRAGPRRGRFGGSELGIEGLGFRVEGLGFRV